jgi:hypothetical protein
MLKKKTKNACHTKRSDSNGTDYNAALQRQPSLLVPFWGLIRRLFNNATSTAGVAAYGMG